MAPRPFAQWGVDLLGPFPPGPGQVKHFIVAIDYYTKWVEAKPLASISTVNYQKFMWKQVVTRWTKDQIEVLLGRAPQTNGQVEAVNKVILKGLKRRLEGKKGSWADELASVLWSYRTTPQSSTGETPFRLTYGVDTVIPVEVGEPSPRILLKGGSEAIEKDLVDETRQMAHLAEAAIKQRIALRYNGKVLKRSLGEGDLVLRRNDIGLPTPGEGKLAANWEGPYRVKEVVGKGGYKLERLDGNEVPRTWNMTNLKSLDNIVKDGKIVPDDPDDDDVEPPPVPAAKTSVAPNSSIPSSEVGHPQSDPDCQILNRDDGTVDAVPLQTRPPSPRADAAEKSSDP
ncbi:uncharacterized protein [Arachis hypogaea]|uniref:uncharacterized protein n=1 Tax=Arachis hypogaea TaxID=3818 RepID=UPI003B21010B